MISLSQPGGVPALMCSGKPGGKLKFGVSGVDPEGRVLEIAPFLSFRSVFSCLSLILSILGSVVKSCDNVGSAGSSDGRSHA